MNRIMGLALVVLLGLCPRWSLSDDESVPPVEVRQPVSVDELVPGLDAKAVSIKFKVTRLEGVAQLSKPGQAPSFVIETESGKGRNRLDVWVEGELANVLEHLQLGFLQDNQLKSGTTIVATGMLRVHTTDPHLYFLSVTKWRNFRILSSPEKK